MKNLIEIITEYSTPDYINDFLEYTNKNGEKIQEYISEPFNREYAHAFIYSTKTSKIAMGNDGSQYHYHIVKNNIDNCAEKTGLTKDNYCRRIEKEESRKDFWKMFPEMKKVRCGRLWDLRDCEIPSDMIIIGWWEELTEKQWTNYVLKVLAYYEKKFNNKIDYSNVMIVGINNNCELFIFDPQKAKELKMKKRSKQSQDIYGIAKAIHLANQEDKDKFYAAFKKNRDENNQKIYNHTKSKTEAEWRSLRYQENMKSIEDIIDENSK